MVKSFKIKKREQSRPVFIVNFNPLPKPKIPLKLITNVHKPEVYVELVFEDEK